MTNKIKQMARKYIVSAIAGMALMAGANAYAGESKLPICPETRTAVKNVVEQRTEQENQECRGYLDNAKALFNKALEDGYLSVDEETQVYNLFKKAELKKEIYERNVTEEDKALYTLVDKGLYYGQGNKQVERELKENGLEVEVQQSGIPTKRAIQGGLAMLAAVVIGVSGICYLYETTRRED